MSIIGKSLADLNKLNIICFGFGDGMFKAFLILLSPKTFFFVCIVRIINIYCIFWQNLHVLKMSLAFMLMRDSAVAIKKP